MDHLEYVTLFLLLCMTYIQPSALSRTQDVCTGETLTAECPHGNNDVIMMTSALYGRMRMSKCIEEPPTGCKADVLGWADRKCSGRKSCTISLLDEDLFKSNPCGKDDMPYLQIQYTCVEVHALGSCREGHVIRNSVKGALHYPGQGQGHRCKVTFQLQAGQRLNISLYDFDTRKMIDGSGCINYAHIEEPGVTRVSVPECRGRQRETQVYVSKGNVVDVTLYRNERESRFLLTYKGCGIPDLPVGVNIKVDGHTATAVCNVSGVKTHLKCQDNVWVGEIGQCQEKYVDVALGISLPGGGWGSNIGLVIVVGLGVIIGATAGLTSLLIFAMCFKRARNNGYTYAPSNSSTRYYSADSKMYLHLAPVRSNQKQGKAPPDREMVEGARRHTEIVDRQMVAGRNGERQQVSNRRSQNVSQVMDRQERQVSGHFNPGGHPMSSAHLPLDGHSQAGCHLQSIGHPQSTGHPHPNVHSQSTGHSQPGGHTPCKYTDQPSLCKSVSDKPPSFMKVVEGPNKQTDGGNLGQPESAGPTVSKEANYETPFVENKSM